MTGPSVSRPAALFVLAALLALAGCGPQSEGERRVRGQAEVSGEQAITPSAETDPFQGKWRTARSSAPEAAEVPANVKALPYLQGYKAAQDKPIVVEHEPEATYQGLNLYISGHAAEAVLMDMSGRILHRWRYPLRRLWKGLRKDPEAAKVEYWRRVYLYPNGDLLGIYEGNGLVKLNARSRVLWSHRGDIHHDLQVMADGTIYVLDREGKIIPRINPEEGVLEDFVTVLDPGGKVIRRLSILECFERSPYASLLGTMPRKGDIFHTNTLEVLDGRFADRHPAVRKGNLLVSLWGVHVLGIIDPEKGKVVWARTGGWRRQHQPTFLDDGRMLLFDNLGAARDRSRVIELDPLTGKTLWQYGGTPEVDLFSKTLGSAQRLPNGNTLITESENGRALEVTRDGRVVWEFHNPHRAGERNELVAVLFEMVRLPPDFPFRGYNREDA
jgi:hypothetical protein